MKIKDFVSKKEKILVKKENNNLGMLTMMIIVLLIVLILFFLLLFGVVGIDMVYPFLTFSALEIVILYFYYYNILALTDKNLYIRRFNKVEKINLSKVNNLYLVKPEGMSRTIIHLKAELQGDRCVKGYNLRQRIMNKMRKRFLEVKDKRNEDIIKSKNKINKKEIVNVMFFLIIIIVIGLYGDAVVMFWIRLLRSLIF
ncbi:hypothetical protein [Sporohalobacter salinus]|uniref:hypothetical protein n=1 Tax=Sporohalobacter salinus TaxID=1494606 RepID=UPI00195F6147|nr:hypothetical protein [Sporohalobacter salinus]MBM7624638.1 hypothetical protein [Sporohalobacter salinus]